jgi:hypothetical protein
MVVMAYNPGYYCSFSVFSYRMDKYAKRLNTIANVMRIKESPSLAQLYSLGFAQGLPVPFILAMT